METARIMFGLAAAVIVPWGLGWHSSRPGSSVAVTLGYGAFIVGPYLGRARPEALLACAVLVSLGVGRWDRGPRTSAAGPSRRVPLYSGSIAPTRWWSAVALGVGALLSLWAVGSRIVSFVADLAADDRAAVLLSAFLIAVFGGGSLAEVATGPVRRGIGTLPPGPQRNAALEFMSGSRSIGLLERGLLFCFFAAGQPEVAALVLAAKSLARVPTADHGKHASEYLLIGTLASVIASSAMSMAARSAMGLPVF